jgi:hypothetical protein
MVYLSGPERSGYEARGGSLNVASQGRSDSLLDRFEGRSLTSIATTAPKPSHVFGNVIHRYLAKTRRWTRK